MDDRDDCCWCWEGDARLSFKVTLGIGGVGCWEATCIDGLRGIDWSDDALAVICGLRVTGARKSDSGLGDGFRGINGIPCPNMFDCDADGGTLSEIFRGMG